MTHIQDERLQAFYNEIDTLQLELDPYYPHLFDENMRHLKHLLLEFIKYMDTFSYKITVTLEDNTYRIETLETDIKSSQ